MRNTALIFTACAVLLPFLPAQGQQTRAGSPTKSDRSKMRSARSFRKLEVDGQEVAQNVKKLTTELRWHKSLASSLASGRAKSRPVLWIQALGDLDGYL